MNITEKKLFDQWIEYTLKNNNDMSVSFLNFGGIITKIAVPNRTGKQENIVLSYENYEQYQENPYYLGAIIGRVAGRIQNASFKLNGNKYILEANERNHHLHGGTKGFHRVIWETTPFQKENIIGVKLSYVSPDGEGGYPGQVHATVTYTLTNHNEFIIDYEAVSDQQTVLTLTNHTYFNLSGNLKNTIENHIVQMNSDKILKLDSELIPTGEILHATNTPFDFRNGKMLAEGLHSNHPQNMIVGNGYDHYFLLNDGTINVREKSSGRVMTIKTNQPGVVMYTSNSLEEGVKLRGGVSKKYLGVCFETQGSPASLHHSGLPEIILEAGQKYEKQTVFSFHYE